MSLKTIKTLKNLPGYSQGREYYPCGHIRIGAKKIEEIKGFQTRQKIRPHLGGELSCTQCAIDGRWKK